MVRYAMVYALGVPVEAIDVASENLSFQVARALSLLLGLHERWHVAIFDRVAGAAVPDSLSNEVASIKYHSGSDLSVVVFSKRLESGAFIFGCGPYDEHPLKEVKGTDLDVAIEPAFGPAALAIAAASAIALAAETKGLVEDEAQKWCRDLFSRAEDFSNHLQAPSDLNVVDIDAGLEAFKSRMRS